MSSTDIDKKKQGAWQICKGCPDSRKNFGIGLSCGRFLHPATEPRKTCGCLLVFKTLLKFMTSCPQGKW